ncbi:MAG: DNA primase [Christensenellales bacterium]
MANYPDSWMQELRYKNDIADVVGEYVSLTPKGGRLWGCCPFHSEKTASFNVQRDKQMFYCFGCHKGGDVIKFLMEMEKYTFSEAVTTLAKRANMAVPDLASDEDRKLREQKDRLYGICREAALFYAQTLLSPEGKKAREYLARRAVDGKTVRHFGIGYAPQEWDKLLNHLHTKGYRDEDIYLANLAGKGKKGYYDQFRDRLMFPIISHMGKVIGFGGRVLDNSLPKYINSAETPVFNKRRNLYGLNYIGRQHAAPLLLVEGYMDVVSLFQHGGYTASASLGTSLTREQAQLIKRYTGDVLIAYDGDAAGQNATLRGLDILEGEGLHVRVVRFPKGMDPDDYIKKEGKEGFEKALQNAQALTMFKLDLLSSGFDLRDPQGRAQYAKEGAKLIGKLPDPVEREMYLDVLKQHTGIDTRVLKDQMAASGESEPKERIVIAPRRPSPPVKALDKARRILVCYMAAGRENAEYVLARLKEDDFGGHVYFTVVKGISELPKNLDFSVADVLLACNNADDVAFVLSSGEDRYLMQEIDDCIAKVKLSSMEQEYKRLTQLIPQTNQEEQTFLAKMLQTLRQEIEQYKKRG